MTTTTTGTANAINESTKSLVINGPEVGNLPVKKRVIPSASLQLVPFYSEVDSTLYKTPLLIALLGSFDKKSSFLSQRKPRPPRSGKFELEEVDDLDRLVVKVYDVLGTAEYHHTVIIREYVIFLAELQEDYHNLAHKYFQPEDRAWWAAHIKEVLVVQPKPQNKLKLWVSRKAIEQIVADGVASGAEPKPLVKITTVPSPKEILTAGPNTSTATPSDFIISEKKNTILGSKSGTPGVTEKTLSTKGNASAPLGSVKVPPNVSAKAGQMSSNGSTSVKSSKTKQQAESFPATTEATRGASLAPVVTDKKPREGSAPSKKVTLATSVKIISPKSNAGSGGASSKDNASKKGSSKAISKPTVAVAAAKASIVTAPAAASVAKATKADVPSSPIATPAEPVVPAAIAQTYVQADVADDSPQDVAVASDVAKSENASADVDYNEDFEADSVVVGKGKDIVDTTVTVEMETAVEGKVPVAVADYDEDFEEENSLENENENGTTADDANTTDAVHSASAADADACSHQDQDQDHDTVQDTVQDHDQENDQDQDATSKSAVTAMAVGGASDGKGDADSRYFSDFEENSLGVNSGIILDDQSSVNIIEECYENNGDDKNNSNRPLSMIEAAQREFDEIGEDDGVFFNSVDDEDF